MVRRRRRNPSIGRSPSNLKESDARGSLRTPLRATGPAHRIHVGAAPATALFSVQDRRVVLPVDQRARRLRRHSAGARLDLPSANLATLLSTSRPPQTASEWRTCIGTSTPLHPASPAWTTCSSGSPARDSIQRSSRTPSASRSSSPPPRASPTSLVFTASPHAPSPRRSPSATSTPTAWPSSTSPTHSPKWTRPRRPGAYDGSLWKSCTRSTRARDSPASGSGSGLSRSHRPAPRAAIATAGTWSPSCSRLTASFEASNSHDGSRDGAPAGSADVVPALERGADALRRRDGAPPGPDPAATLAAVQETHQDHHRSGFSSRPHAVSLSG